MWCMAALSAGTLLPLRGFTMVTTFCLGAALCLALDPPFAGKVSTAREPRDVFVLMKERSWWSRDPSTESCLEAVSTSSWEGLSGLESESGSSMSRQRGAIK